MHNKLCCCFWRSGT